MNSSNSPVTRKAVCSPMSTALSPIRSMQRETTIMRSPHSLRARRGGHGEHLLHDPPAGPVDELVQLDQRVGTLEVAVGERVEGDPNHFFRPVAHLRQPLDELAPGPEVGCQLRQFRDRDALVAHPLEVDRVVEDGEHEAQVGGDRPLLGEDRLDGARSR